MSDWIKIEIIAGTNFLPISNTDHSYIMQLRPFSGRLAHVHRIDPSWKKSIVPSGFSQWEYLMCDIGLLSSVPNAWEKYTIIMLYLQGGCCNIFHMGLSPGSWHERVINNQQGS